MLWLVDEHLARFSVTGISVRFHILRSGLYSLGEQTHHEGNFLFSVLNKDGLCILQWKRFGAGSMLKVAAGFGGPANGSLSRHC